MNPNVSVVKRYFAEVLDRHQFDVMPELFHPDVVMHRPGIDIQGLKDIQKFFPIGLSVYTSFESELTNFIADGDMVGAKVYHRTRVKPHTMQTRFGPIEIADEQNLNWSALAQFRLVEGRIAEEWVERDEIAMIQQVAQVELIPLKSS